MAAILSRPQCVNVGHCKLYFSSIAPHVRLASKPQYLFVVGTKPFPANQDAKYECFQRAFQIFHIFGRQCMLTAVSSLWSVPKRYSVRKSVHLTHVGVHKRTTNIHPKISPFWRNFRHWVHWELSKWQHRFGQKRNCCLYVISWVEA